MNDYVITFAINGINGKKIIYLVADLDAICAICQALDHLEVLLPDCGKTHDLRVAVEIYREQPMPQADFIADQRFDPPLHSPFECPLPEAA